MQTLPNVTVGVPRRIDGGHQQMSVLTFYTLCGSIYIYIYIYMLYRVSLLLCHRVRQFYRIGRASSFTMFLDRTQRPTTVARTSLDEWSARRRDLYLTTHNTHDRHLRIPVGFEPTFSADDRPKTYALDRAATGINNHTLSLSYPFKAYRSRDAPPV